MDKKLGHEERAEHFKQTRQKRLFEVAEDYTELIHDLIQSQGQARACDIARQLGVSHVSVLKTVKKLIRDGYLVRDSDNEIKLTPKGKAMASFSKRKHLVLPDFLKRQKFRQIPNRAIRLFILATSIFYKAFCS